MNNNLLPNENSIEMSNANFNKTLSKKTPDNPIKYFTIVSLVAFLIKDLVVALPSSLYSWIIMFISFSSSAIGNNVDLSQQYPVWNILDVIFGSIITILFGILFVKYITNKTTFEGSINKYRFLYYSWPFVATGFILDIVGLISSVVLLNVQKNDVSVAGVGMTLALTSIISVISFGVTILSAYLCARLLNSAATGDEKNQEKELRFLAGFVTISSIISLICSCSFGVTRQSSAHLSICSSHFLRENVKYIAGSISFSCRHRTTSLTTDFFCTTFPRLNCFFSGLIFLFNVPFGVKSGKFNGN